VNIFAAVKTGLLAALSQRAFWTEAQIKELVTDKYSKSLRLYKNTDYPGQATQPGNLRAIRILATEEQQTWLVTDSHLVFCVLDDRSWEEPQVRWMKSLAEVIPVHSDENWSDEAGALQFGKLTKKWLYSKYLFENRSVADAVAAFLSAAEDHASFNA
jgi:hypothetical protein